MTIANWIPMISWGPGPSTYTFPDPPSGDPLGQVFAADWDTLTANKGKMWIQYNFTEQTFTITYAFLTESDKAAIMAFFDGWAKLGNTFNYFPSSNLGAFFSCTLDEPKIVWKPLIPDGSGGMQYQMSWTLRNFYV